MDFLRSWQGRRVLVTGGTGFIGRQVVHQGIAAGLDMHTVSSSCLDNLLPDVVHHQVDLRDQHRLVRMIANLQPQGVIHLAAAGVGYDSAALVEAIQVNTLGAANLLAAVDRLSDKPSVVLASSGFEYALQTHAVSEHAEVAPFSPYGVSKAAATLAAALYADKMPVTVLRLFSIYGIGEQEPRLVPYIIACAKEDRLIELTAGAQVRDYMFVTDAAESFWRALVLPPELGVARILNIGTGKPVMLRNMVTTLERLLWEYGLHPRIIFGAKPYRPEEPLFYVPNIVRMIQALRWQPPTELETGLRQTIEAML